MKRFPSLCALGFLLLAVPTEGGTVAKREKVLRLSAIQAELQDLRRQGQERSPRAMALKEELERLSARPQAQSLPLVHAGTRAVPPQILRPGGGLGIIPPIIPGCGLEVNGFSWTEGVEIPDPGIVSISILVSGLSGSIWDVNVRTFLQHTFSNDIQMSLTSPSGTTVTLTSNNPSLPSLRATHGTIPGINVFNGTVWDDQADPDGDVPYSFNNGLVTDHQYVDNETATPLVPEEAFSAFRGENPNGVWTLLIADQFSLDTGFLTAWDLEIATFSGTVSTSTVVLSNSPDLEITGGPHETSLTASGLGSYLLDVQVQTNLTHTWSEDVDMVLASPSGTYVTLTTRNGGSEEDVFDGTVWRDNADPDGAVPYTTNDGLATDHAYSSGTTATPLVPEEAFGAFRGENPNGTWRLRIYDTFPSEDDGLLSSWELTLTTASCVLGCSLNLTCPPSQTVTAPPGSISAVVTYPPPTVSGTCPNPTVSCAPPSGSAFPVGTTVVNCTAQSGSVSATCAFNVTVNAQPPAAIPTAGHFGLVALGASLLALGMGLLLRRT